MSNVRWGLVRRVRAQIAAGTYMTQRKLWIASERFAAHLRETERLDCQTGLGDQCDRPSTSPLHPRTT